MGISSGKAVTAEAQGLCREAGLSLTCPAALPPGNNKPLRSSCWEFPLSSGLLWDPQLDLPLLFSLNTVLNHMLSSSHLLPRAASHSSGPRCYTQSSDQLASSDDTVNSPLQLKQAQPLINFLTFSLISLEIIELGNAYSSSHWSQQGNSFQWGW